MQQATSNLMFLKMSHFEEPAFNWKKRENKFISFKVKR